jgi:hypothetical protein
MTLKLILKKLGVRMWTGFIWIRRPVMSSSEHGTEPSGSIKDGKFPEKLSDYQPLEKVCVPWG